MCCVGRHRLLAEPVGVAVHPAGQLEALPRLPEFMGGSADGDWVGRTRTAGGSFGNAMVYDADNGPVGNTLIPVLFALGDDASSYGFFLDSVYKQQWDLIGAPWTVEMWGDQVR